MTGSNDVVSIGDTIISFEKSDLSNTYDDFNKYLSGESHVKQIDGSLPVFKIGNFSREGTINLDGKHHHCMDRFATFF